MAINTGRFWHVPLREAEEGGRRPPASIHHELEDYQREEKLAVIGKRHRTVNLRKPNYLRTIRLIRKSPGYESAAPPSGAARTFLERGAGRFAYSSTCQASARFLTLRRFMVFGALHAEVAVAVADVDLEATR